MEFHFESLIWVRMRTVFFHNEKSFSNCSSTAFSFFKLAAWPIYSSFRLFVAKIREPSVVHQQGITVPTPHKCSFFHLNWKQNEIKKKKHYLKFNFYLLLTSLLTTDSFNGLVMITLLFNIYYSYQGIVILTTLAF